MNESDTDKVNKFSYLGSVVIIAGGAAENMRMQIPKANADFIQLAKEISDATKMKIL